MCKNHVGLHSWLQLDGSIKTVVNNLQQSRATSTLSLLIDRDKPGSQYLVWCWRRERHKHRERQEKKVFFFLTLTSNWIPAHVKLDPWSRQIGSLMLNFSTIWLVGRWLTLATLHWNRKQVYSSVTPTLATLARASYCELGYTSMTQMNMYEQG